MIKTLWNKFGWIVTTILGSVIMGAGYAVFLAPSNLNAGGISGLAAVIVSALKLVFPNMDTPLVTVGTLTIAINLPLFAIAGKKIGKRFFFGSLLGMFVSSMVMDYFPFAVHDVDPLMSAIYGGAIIGFGVGIVFVSGTSTGGADIVVRLVKLKARNMNIGQIAMGFDAIVICLTGLVYGDISNALYTGISVFLVGKMLDAVVYGFDNSKVAWIISSAHEQMVQAITNKLGRGATYLHGQGAFTGRETKVILVAVSPKQVAELKDVVTSIDPNAFIIMQEAHKVLGDGFGVYDKNGL